MRRVSSQLQRYGAYKNYFLFSPPRKKSNATYFYLFVIASMLLQKNGVVFLGANQNWNIRLIAAVLVGLFILRI